MEISTSFLEELAAQCGTPFWLYDFSVLRERVALLKRVSSVSGVRLRYAMKACSLSSVLTVMRDAGVWIDAVSGNEIVRAIAAGFQGGHNEPQIVLSSDVFRDNALDAACAANVLISAGGKGMIEELAERDYRGPIGLRVNPGFGHGHVQSCDTGGPSSKHGIWHEELESAACFAEGRGMRATFLHAHIGSGPELSEFSENMLLLAQTMGGWCARLASITTVSLGGGIPYDYRAAESPDIEKRLVQIYAGCVQRVRAAAGRDIRVEAEPGRFYVAPAARLVTRVRDVKETGSNEKGQGALFVMIDGAFSDLVRPAMYGAYHRISIPAREGAPLGPTVVAGPLCESGDVFTRDGNEMLVPRQLPRPSRGDLLCIHDAGAYGYTMSSQYNSLGRAPQVVIESDGTAELHSRRETVEDVMRAETRVQLALPRA